MSKSLDREHAFRVLWGVKKALFGIILPLLLLGGAWLSVELWSNRQVKRWQEFKTSAEAKGDRFTYDAWLPPAVPDEENFARHPWMERALTDESSVIARLEAMSPKAIRGMEQWHGSQSITPSPQQAEAVLQHYASFAPEFDAIHQSCARKQCRLSNLTSLSTSTLRSTQLSRMQKILECHAQAALIAGQEDVAVTDLTALLRLGAHLRSQNLVIYMVLGAGAEARALTLINTSLPTGAFRPESRKKLLEAMRTRPARDEIPFLLRTERQFQLQIIDLMENPAVENGDAVMRWPVRTFPSLKRAHLSQCRRFICEQTASLLLVPARTDAWRLEQEKPEPKAPAAIPGIGLSQLTPIISGLMLQEEEFDQLRRILAAP